MALHLGILGMAMMVGGYATALAFPPFDSRWSWRDLPLAVMTVGACLVVGDYLATYLR